jgi:hypothetical protein
MNLTIHIEKQLEYDVVVCGGGFAGVAAAVSAARQGVRTLLVESGGELGGDITKSIVPQILDGDGKGGMVKDIFEFLNARHRTSPRRGQKVDENGLNLPGTMVDLEYVKYYLEKACFDAGVDILYHSNAVHTEREGTCISHVLVAGEAGCTLVSARIFIDATGNGLVASLAGCSYSFGHPETGHPQPCSASMLVTGLDERAPLTNTNAQKDELKTKMMNAGISVSSEWISLMTVPQKGVHILGFNNQYDVDPCDALSLSRATSRGRMECIEVADQMRNLEEFRNMEIVSVSSHIGVREGRRIRGLYTLTFEDVTEGRQFDDAICSVSFGIDVHKTAKDDNADHKKGRRVKTYHIPYRALVPADCDNLLLAGRCISGDFHAHASYRVAGDVTPMGEAAGYAAALCVKENITPHAVDGVRISRFMRQLGYTI